MGFKRLGTSKHEGFPLPVDKAAEILRERCSPDCRPKEGHTWHPPTHRLRTNQNHHPILLWVEMLTQGPGADQVAESQVLCHESTAKPEVTSGHSSETRGDKWRSMLRSSFPMTGSDNQWKSQYLLDEWPVKPLQDALECRRLLPKLPHSLWVGRDQCVLGEDSVPVIHAAHTTSRGPPRLPAPSVVK